MGIEANGPNDDRFRDVFRVLESLTNSHSQLPKAQVIMNERLERTERNVDILSTKFVEFVVNVNQLTTKMNELTVKMTELADGQKHTDDRIDALADIVRQLIDRNGNPGIKPN